MMFGVHMGAGCGFAPAKYHFVPSSPAPPPIPTLLSYTSARNMKATQRLDPHLGCTLSFTGLVAAIKLSGNSKKEQRWGRGGRGGGDQLGLALHEDIICDRVPPLTLRRNSAHFFPPPLPPPPPPVPPAVTFSPAVPSYIFSLWRCDPEGSPRERSASGTNLTPQSREREGRRGGRREANGRPPLFFFFFPFSVSTLRSRHGPQSREANYSFPPHEIEARRAQSSVARYRRC